MAEMNITPARAGLTPQIWDGQFFSEYVRANRFARYMGKAESSMIQLKDDLTVKRGDTITFSNIRRLVGAGVTDHMVLEGNEELLDARSMKLRVHLIRHGVAVDGWTEQQSSIDLRNAAKPALKNWSLERMRNDLITAFSSISVNDADSVPYAIATPTQRDAWVTANADRVRFGAAAANNTGVMATSLATLDPVADRMTGKLLSLAKRQAQTANPHIRPIQMVDETDEEWFVCFMPSRVFRDFSLDPDVLETNRQARPREGKWMENPLFSGSDLMWNGIFVREIPELPVLTGAGTGGEDVAASFLCGAQAMGVGWAQRTETRLNERDYQEAHGVAVREIRGIGKLVFGKDGANDTGTKVDNGVYTLFTSAPADS